MRLHRALLSQLTRCAFWQTARHAFPQVWAAGRKSCLTMVAAGLLAAVLAPVSVVIVGILVAKLKDVIDGQAGGLDTFGLWVLLAGLAALLVVACNSAARYAKMRLGDELSWRVHGEILQHAAELDLATLEEKSTQDMLERATQEAGRDVLKFAEGLLKVVSSGVQVGGLAGVLFWIDPFWASVLVLLGLPFILSRSYLSRVQHEIKRNKTTLRRWTRYYAKQLTQRECVPSTKMLGLSPLLIQRHDATMRDILRANERVYRMQAVGGVVATSLSVVVLIVAVILVARQAIAGTITTRQFATFWLAAWKLHTALADLAGSMSLVWDAQWSIANTREFLQLQPAFRNRGALRPAPIRGQIELRNVTFAYPGSRRPVICGLSLSIAAGETVAIVGHNGAGKTTLAKLITRLYQPTEGEVLIDGVPVEELDIEALYARIAFVFQTPARFEATAGENIAFGDWRRLLDRPELVRQIACAARVDEMIEQLPDGYDTLLGRMFGEHDLSGGQWQKLSIARALACDPAIVILDEPAANLDVDSEYTLYQGIGELIGGRTTILISHRFSTVRMADRIFVLDEGRIVEEGPHKVLMARGGAYAAMCRIHEATLHMQKRPRLLDVPISSREAPLDYPTSCPPS